jgi:hypothetical protein
MFGWLRKRPAPAPPVRRCGAFDLNFDTGKSVYCCCRPYGHDGECMDHPDYAGSPTARALATKYHGQFDRTSNE